MVLRRKRSSRSRLFPQLLSAEGKLVFTVRNGKLASGSSISRIGLFTVMHFGIRPLFCTSPGLYFFSVFSWDFQEKTVGYCHFIYHIMHSNQIDCINR